MRAEEGNEIWRIYYPAAFSLWTQSRGEQIKNPALLVLFVSELSLLLREEREEMGAMRQGGRERRGWEEEERQEYMSLVPQPSNSVMLRVGKEGGA